MSIFSKCEVQHMLKKYFGENSIENIEPIVSNDFDELSVQNPFVTYFGNVIAIDNTTSTVAKKTMEDLFFSYLTSENDVDVSFIGFRIEHKTKKELTPVDVSLFFLADSASYPEPFLSDLVPDSNLPSSTSNFSLYGSFFTPATTVEIEGQTVNNVNFISDNEMLINVTTGAIEGYFDLILNNGTEKIFMDALLVVLGTVFTPLTNEWTLTEPVNVDNDIVYLETKNSSGSAEWSQELDYTKDFSVRFFIRLASVGWSITQEQDIISLLNVSDDSLKFKTTLRKDVTTELHLKVESAADATKYVYSTPAHPTGIESMEYLYDKEIEFRYVGGIMYLFIDSILENTFSDVVTENMKIKASVERGYDIHGIKYIELAT